MDAEGFEEDLGLQRIATLVDPDRVRRAREARRMTQSELARRIAEAAGHEISPAALSQIERGLTRPSPETLAGLAKATGYQPAFFVRRTGAEASDSSRTLSYFRSLRSTSSRERRGALAQAYLVHDFVNAIESKIRLPELDVPNLSSERPNASTCADRLRRRWDLSEGPIENVVRLLENHGLVVARLSTGLAEVDGFSVAFVDRPIVILGNDKGKRDRSRFDASHELGHLVMHRTGPLEDSRAVESEAHAFAAAFLMPRDAILKDFTAQRLSWGRLLELKLRWGVSIAALVRRARDLGLLAPHEYTNAMKALSARGWRKNEPGDKELGPPEASRMLEAACELLQQDGFSLSELVRESGLPLDELQTILAASVDPRPRLRI